MKRTGMLLALIVLLGVAAGCGNKPAAAPPENGTNVEIQGSGAQNIDSTQNLDSENDSPEDKEIKDTKEDVDSTRKQTIEVYLTDNDLMELKQVSREIEVSSEHSKYESAFKALQTAEDGMLSLWENVALSSVNYSEADGQLLLDVELPAASRLGAGGEALAIEALKQTMFQFEEVKQIELTVDGEQVESLMGHADLEHPMTR
ncbi:GerMN domain-containing protein [Paenibacillus sanguinis]|uniref:GerMN domain-containing protein n=1 Tax=Paenibacillus sanguinis TaxID=225906 RepID=UPI00035D9CE4|nr:GerMN domain-containing protein [Paenibacillus sanguinis]